MQDAWKVLEEAKREAGDRDSLCSMFAIGGYLYIQAFAQGSLEGSFREVTEKAIQTQ